MTPSRYNAEREVVGIPNWAEKTGSDAAIAKWRKESDYGICVKTGGGIYGFAINVEDEATALGYANQLTAALRLGHFVFRYRENSGRLLVPIRLASDDDRFKGYTSFIVPGGTIEILGGGKQFVAFGTHMSGARYQWGIAVNTTPEHLDAVLQELGGSDVA